MGILKDHQFQITKSQFYGLQALSSNYTTYSKQEYASVTNKLTKRYQNHVPPRTMLLPLVSMFKLYIHIKIQIPFLQTTA